MKIKIFEDFKELQIRDKELREKIQSSCGVKSVPTCELPAVDPDIDKPKGKNGKCGHPHCPQIVQKGN